MPATQYGLGWIPDIPDRRDHLYAAPAIHLAKLPTSTDLRSQFPRPPYDQGQLGSCTGNGIAGAIEFDRAKQGFVPDFIPSRLFIYYNERVREHSVASDSGAMIRDGIKTVNKQGVCPEADWPYDDQSNPGAKVFQKPDAAAYTAAKKFRATSYQRVMQNLNQMKGCLADGFPFILGFTCYDSLESAATAASGDIPMPGAGEGVIGGHCILAVGYDDARQVFLIRNSWGAAWGVGGYGTIPYAYLVDASLSQDFWTIRTMTA